MFCGNVQEKYLASYYVVNRTKNIRDRLGLKMVFNNDRYNPTKSGWFDSATFEDWFKCNFLPEVKHDSEPVVLTDDNLSFHISI